MNPRQAQFRNRLQHFSWCYSPHRTPSVYEAQEEEYYLPMDWDFDQHQYSPSYDQRQASGPPSRSLNFELSNHFSYKSVAPLLQLLLLTSIDLSPSMLIPITFVYPFVCYFILECIHCNQWRFRQKSAVSRLSTLFSPTLFILNLSPNLTHPSWQKPGDQRNSLLSVLRARKPSVFSLSLLGV